MCLLKLAIILVVWIVILCLTDAHIRGVWGWDRGIWLKGG